MDRISTRKTGKIKKMQKTRRKEGAKDSQRQSLKFIQEFSLAALWGMFVETERRRQEGLGAVLGEEFGAQ